MIRLARLPFLARKYFLLLTFLVLGTHHAFGYDFTNLKPTKQDFVTPQSTAHSTVPIADRETSTGPDVYSDERRVSPSQTPIHWFLSKLYGGNASLPSIDGIADSHRVCKSEDQRPYLYVHIPDDPDEIAEPMLDEKNEEEAVKYNVSSLGLKDPFARYATKLSYDYSIDVGEAHNNGRGSILTLLNGTIYAMGSVGAMAAVGWNGGSNETRQRANVTKATSGTSNLTNSNPSKNRTDANINGTSTPPANAPSASSAFTPHSDGMTGVWLAFTSQHALTGGYTLHARQMSVTNNVLFHNITFRSNFTIDSQGRFDFVFTLGTVDDSDQVNKDSRPSPPSSTGASPGQTTPTNSSSHAGKDASNNFGSLDDQQGRARQQSSRDKTQSGPIRLRGPHCVQMQGTNVTEAAFRMRCRGSKGAVTTV